MGFTGWPASALAFYEGLEATNTREYWQARKAEWEADVKAPFVALSEAVEAEFGPLHLFRPHRDVRFSKDKSPYKTHAGAVTESDDGSVFYVQLSAAGLLLATGYYQMASDQLERYRAAIADERAGPGAEAVCAELVEAGYELGGQALKVAPRGYPRDHPRAALLRHKGLYVSRQHRPARWLATAKALDRVVDAWRGAEPLNRWLADHVGPSRLPPPELS
ncbi:MAG: DUF2461 domain-containing protein [Acidimicrobiales bacterium]